MYDVYVHTYIHTYRFDGDLVYDGAISDWIMKGDPCMHVCASVCMCMCVFVRESVYVCMCGYIGLDNER